MTTSVDAGSSGWTQFEGFKEFILGRERTRLMALINLSALGMMVHEREGGFGPTVGISGGPQTLLPEGYVGELQDLRYAQVEELVRCIRDNHDVAIGVKVRIDAEVSGEPNAVPVLERARQVADATGSFVMVHVARTPVPMGLVLDHLRPRDIVTHCFHYSENNVLDDNEQVRTEVLEARSKGILMDTGAAQGNYGIRVSSAAIGQGFGPDTISTDVTKGAGGLPSRTLPDVMSLFMGLGMTLEDVIAAATTTPARAIGQEGVLGTLRVGAAGDAAVLELEAGEFHHDDGHGASVKAGTRLKPVLTVKDGTVWSAGEGGSEGEALR